MTGTAIFVGWGLTHPGRERFAMQHFREFVEKLEQFRAEGLIEGFETTLLAPYGGPLDGFTLIHGKPELLAQLRLREDIRVLTAKAELDHALFTIAWASTGDRVPLEFALMDEALVEIERELVPA